MQDGRFIAMVTKDLQTLNLKFDQVMFNSLVLTWEKNFEVTFGTLSVFQHFLLNFFGGSKCVTKWQFLLIF